MRLAAEVARAAGNVLLQPTTLAPCTALGSCQRALIAGGRDPTATRAAVDQLTQRAPSLAIDIAGQDRHVNGLRAIRRRRYDVVCVLLTGEGFTREKMLAVLAGAPVSLAYGANGRWYEIRRPPVHPGSGKWWARLTLALLLCALYFRICAGLLVMDSLRRLVPSPHPSQAVRRNGSRRVTFVVPTYNQQNMMDFCLPPLLAEAGDEHRIIVVDDASSDDTAEYVRRNYPSVGLVRLARNRGFAGAVRAGIAASDTPFFSLINTDVKVRKGFLAALMPHFERADTFAVCSRIELPRGSHMETGNVAPAWSGLLEPYHVPPTEPGPILYAGGASSVYDRAKYEALRGFETLYRPLYFEDIELGYRAWRRGWRSLFEPQASVWHERRAWIGKRFGDAYANETFLKNSLLFVWKNVRDRGLLAQHLAYVCARLASEILRGEGTMARAVLRAGPLSGWVMLKRWAEYRRGDLPDRKIMDLARSPAAQRLAEAGAR
jgi:GT2 family glycosyltransferase